MIYIDGKIYEKKDEAKISVYDHGLLYGDGVFEGIRYYDGRAFRLREHITRLFASAKAIRLSIPRTMGELEDIINILIGKRGEKNGYIRLNVTRGKGNLGLNPVRCPRPSL